MNKLLKGIGVFAMVLAIACGNSNPKGLVVLNTTCSFDTIAPDNGITRMEFKVINNTDKPWLPDSVFADCVCLASFYGTESVNPGDTLTIVTQLYPDYEEGAFNKTVTIKTGLEGKQAELKLNVTGFIDVSNVSVEKRYPISSAGGLLFKSKNFDFGQVLQGKIGATEGEVYNNGTTPVTFTAISGMPDYIRMDFFPRTIQPGESSKIKANISTEIYKNVGKATFAMDIVTEADSIPMIPINLLVDLMENFSTLTEEELLNAPQVSFDDTEFNYGTITDGDIVEHTFTVTNKGNSDLYIRKIETGCGCTVATPEKGVLAAGESTTIKAVFNSAHKEGNIRIYVRVITNDPKQPYTQLKIDGKVLPKN